MEVQASPPMLPSPILYQSLYKTSTSCSFLSNPQDEGTACSLIGLYDDQITKEIQCRRPYFKFKCVQYERIFFIPSAFCISTFT